MTAPQQCPRDTRCVKPPRHRGACYSPTLRTGLQRVQMPTPSTEEVRGSYKSYVSEYRGTEYDDAGLEFDRWLAVHDREVAVKALLDARNEFAAAALRGIEPALNHTAARLLHRRADKIQRGQ